MRNAPAIENKRHHPLIDDFGWCAGTNLRKRSVRHDARRPGARRGPISPPFASRRHLPRLLRHRPTGPRLDYVANPHSIEQIPRRSIGRPIHLAFLSMRPANVSRSWAKFRPPSLLNPTFPAESFASRCAYPPISHGIRPRSIRNRGNVSFGEAALHRENNLVVPTRTAGDDHGRQLLIRPSAHVPNLLSSCAVVAPTETTPFLRVPCSTVGLAHN